jgi:hypothetical protein
MAEASRLIKKRGGHRAQITRVISLANNELCDDNVNIAVLEQYHGELVRQRDIISSMDEQVQQIIEEDIIADDVWESSEVIMRTTTMVNKLYKYITETSVAPIISSQTRG